MTEFMTADWSPLGDVFYRKSELYAMDMWTGKLDMAEYDICGAPYGGPFAVMKKPAYVARANSKPLITIYNAAGLKLSEIRWQEGGELRHIGWSVSEKLICVQDDGVILIYNIHGEMVNRIDMGQEVNDRKITDCIIFPSLHDSGVAVMTTAHRFWMKTDITQSSRARPLAEVPGLSRPPSSWTPIITEKTISVLVAKDELLYLINQVEQCKLIETPVMEAESVESYIEMSVSLNGKYIALYTSTGLLWVGSSNLTKRFCELNTGIRNRPTQMVWCGRSAVILYWLNPDTDMQEILVVGHGSDWIKYQFDTKIRLIQEPDGVRVVSDELHEFIHRVPVETDDIFRIGSVAPGAMLFEAEREFRKNNKKAHEYIEEIEGRGEMGEAIRQCILAAGHEFEPAKQKELLRAASFAKGLAPTHSPDDFKEMCQTIRVLHSLRDYVIGIPLTTKQLQLLEIDKVIDRLIYRRQYILAIKICQYFKKKDLENKILAHWAQYKVAHSDYDTPERIAAAIKNKLKDNSALSYSDIAERAIECGKKDLAILLLDSELRANKQIPLLMKIEKVGTALEKAIESGDSNLIYHVLFEMKSRSSMGSFHMEVRNHPAALALLKKYYEATNRQLLTDLYLQDDQHADVAACKIRDSFEESGLESRKKCLQEAVRKYRDAQDEWSIKMVQNQLKLIDIQQEAEIHNIDCTDKSLFETLHILTTKGRHKQVDQMKKDFAIPDRRFWWVKVQALAESGSWAELEHFSKSQKKSPIGYRPFVELCFKHGNKQEATKYLDRVSPDEKVACLLSIGELEQAAETAYQRKSEEELNMVLRKCKLHDRPIIERVHRLLAALNNR